jgi:serine phosphatase RsbU (regulator of sigma subunit)
VAQRNGDVAILIADGLGHGPQAAAAAKEAAVAFDRDPFAAPASVIQAADLRMRGTRGGAVAVACFTGQSQTLKYAGVGNIAGSLRAAADAPGRGLVSHNGTVGVQVRRIQEFEYPCSRGGLLIMHSDGLQTRWSLDAYLGLSSHHPALIAGTLQRDFARGRDDLTVVAVRFPAT